MSRREKGEGSISQRKDGTWTARLNLGLDSDGKRKIKAFYLKPFAENGQLFTKKDKDIIVNIIDHKNKKNGRIIKDMKVLEEYLQKIGCRYMIVSGSKRETVDGKDKKTTTYQIIERPQTNDEQKEATEI